jgi:hypothetical protein
MIPSRRAVVVASILVGACARPETPLRVRADIEAVLAQEMDATRRKDIDAFLSTVDNDLTSPTGQRLTRDELVANIRRDWSIIVETKTIGVSITSFELCGDEAFVGTRQRWVRTMLERDGKTQDLVETTQDHRERWRKRPQGWRAVEVQELGGDTFVNGKRYEEK